MFDLGSGGNSFKFENVGDTVTGYILDMVEEQQTDIDSGEPRTFSNGQPMKMFRVSLQTELREEVGDDGKRDIFLKGSRKAESKSSMAAVLGAVRAATGGHALAPNGKLTLTYSGDGAKASPGKNPPKHYTASYVAPALDLGADPAPAQPVAQPVAQPAAVPPGLEGFTPEQLAAFAAAMANKP